jgi:hypothetical protein
VKPAGKRSPVTLASPLLLGVLLYGTLGGAWATTPIYKCFDRKFDVVYTDVPCKDGAVMDIRAGDADPAAVARLDRARDALDQSAAQRISDMRWAPSQPAYAPAWYPGPGAQNWVDGLPYDYAPISGLSGFANGYPLRGQRGRFNDRDFAFSHPNMGGRR